MAETGKHQCGRCDKAFDSPQALSLHITRVHRKKGKKSTHRRASSNGRPRKEAKVENLENHIHYLFGRIERDIEHYASVNGVPFPTLAEGIASLLRH